MVKKQMRKKKKSSPPPPPPLPHIYLLMTLLQMHLLLYTTVSAQNNLTDPGSLYQPTLMATILVQQQISNHDKTSISTAKMPNNTQSEHENTTFWWIFSLWCDLQESVSMRKTAASSKSSTEVTAFRNPQNRMILCVCVCVCVCVQIKKLPLHAKIKTIFLYIYTPLPSTPTPTPPQKKKMTTDLQRLLFNEASFHVVFLIFLITGQTLGEAHRPLPLCQVRCSVILHKAPSSSSHKMPWTVWLIRQFGLAVRH